MAKQLSGKNMPNLPAKGVFGDDYYRKLLAKTKSELPALVANLTNAEKKLIDDRTKLGILRDNIRPDDEGLAHFMAYEWYETAKFKVDSDTAAVMELRRQIATAEEYIAAAEGK